MEAMHQYKIMMDNGKWLEMADLVIGVSGSIRRGETPTENDDLLGGSDVGIVEDEPGKRMGDEVHDQGSSDEDNTICKK